MGSEFNFYKTRSTDKDKVIQMFNHASDQCRYENGHSYSGGIGMKTEIVEVATVFDTFEQAEEYVLEENGKWGPAMLVKTKDGQYGFGGWCSS